MNAISPVAPPRDLIAQLFASDTATNGRPVLPTGGRAAASAWLERALIDFEALERHLELLGELHGEPVRLPRPRREQWIDAPPDSSLPKAYRHSAPLPDARVVAVTDKGPGTLTDDELAALMLNPVALYDLYDVIDELVPEHWTVAMHNAAAPTPVRPAPEPAPRPVRRGPGALAYVAMAASLLVGVGLGALAFRGTGSGERDALALLALESQEVRGAAKVLRARVASGFDGYATLVFPGADGSPLVVPGPGGQPIPVTSGSGLSAPLPQIAEKAPWAVLIVTEKRAEDAVRKALAARAAPADRPAEISAYLKRELGSAGVGRIAVGVATPGNARAPEER